MKQYIGRHNDLKERLNNHLTKLTGRDKDYYSSLTNEDLLDLKVALSNINNLLTLKITVSAVHWLCKYFSINDSCKETILEAVDRIKPNTKGYDIHIVDPIKILAEVKCIVPVNKGGKFGSAQWNSILDDVIKLKNGKGKLSDTKEFYKFLFLIDLGDRTESAVFNLIRQSRGRSEMEIRKNRHQIKEYISVLDESNSNLSLEKIFIKTIKLNGSLDH